MSRSLTDSCEGVTRMGPKRRNAGMELTSTCTSYTLIWSMDTFPSLLRGFRQRLGLSQHDVASKCPNGHGITQGTLSKWELGIYEPSASQLSMLCAALALNAEDCVKLVKAAGARSATQAAA